MLTRKRWRIGIGHICKMGSIQWWFQLPTHSKRDSTSLNKTLLKSDSTSESGKHGRGCEGAAPESDAARHGTRRPTRLPACQCRVWAFFFPWIRTDSARFAPNRADSARIRPYRSISADNWNSWNRHWIWPEQPKFSSQRYSNVFFAFSFLCFVNQG